MKEGIDDVGKMATYHKLIHTYFLRNDAYSNIPYAGEGLAKPVDQVMLKNYYSLAHIQAKTVPWQ